MTIPLVEDDLRQLREICDTVYSLYELIRDREDSAAIGCLMRPTARTFGRFVEALEGRFENKENECQTRPENNQGRSRMR
jgi:hypothetical protein